MSTIEESPASPPVNRRKWLRVLASIGRILAGVYVGLLVVQYFAQDALIFPGRSSQGSPEARFRPPADCALVDLKTAGGEPVVALFSPALSPMGLPLPDASSRPTILYFYGNGQYLGKNLDEIATIRRMGLNVFMPDYLGYGLSGGRSSESGCYATADAAYDHLRTRPDVDPRKIVIAGFSLGGAVAIDLASRRPAIGLIVSCPFTTMAEMTRSRFPFVPASLLLRHRFANVDKIAKVRCPILISSGQLDQIIPTGMADALASAAGKPVTRIELDAGHDALLRVAGVKERRLIRDFVDSL